jgi:prefoldin subunit 5
MNAESLVRILRAYDVSLDAAAVRAAVSASDSTQLVNWATVHLTPDTLLTVDELNQYAALKESGLAEKLAMSSDLAAARVLSDQEIKDAIEELNRSTQAITRHTDALRQQQEALGRLVDAGRESSKERVAVQEARTRKWQAERSNLASEADELSQSLGSRIRELEQQRTGAGATIQQTVDTLFRSDDKLLSSLQKLGWELETKNDEEQHDVALLRETCARLIKFTVEGIRTKLDRLYLEALELSSQSGAPRVSADRVSALQEELESLYSEILPVAQMSTEQQFLEPALKSLAAKNGKGMVKSAQATSYVHDCLDYLIDRAQDMMARLDAFQAYQFAADAFLDVAKPEIDTQTQTIEVSPARVKSVKQQNDMSPARPQPKQRSRYSTGAPGIGNEPPLEEILRTLAISLPHDDETPDNLRGCSSEAGRRREARNPACARLHPSREFVWGGPAHGSRD